MIDYLNKVTCGDCLDLLKELPDASIDACITDPPYGVTDLELDVFQTEWLAEAVRVLKPHGQICSFGFLPTLAPFMNYFTYRWSGVWIKTNSIPVFHNTKRPKSKQEPFAIFCKPSTSISKLTYNSLTTSGEPYTKTRKNTGYKREGKDCIDRLGTDTFTIDGYVSVNNGTRCVTDVIEGPTKNCMKHADRTIHPTQKPVNVMSTIIQWITNTGDIVLDPFAGSGTTGVGCAQTGRKFIGFELNPEYCDIANKRIKDAQHTLLQEG